MVRSYPPDAPSRSIFAPSDLAALACSAGAWGVQGRGPSRLVPLAVASMQVMVQMGEGMLPLIENISVCAALTR
jgi:hypothetical protein